MKVALALLAVAVTAATAAADPAPYLGDVLLPAGAIEPELRFAIASPGAPYATSQLLAVGGDLATRDGFEMGILLTQSLAPDGGYTALAVDHVWSLGRHVAVRLDLAAERAPFVTGQEILSAAYGLGLSLSIPIGRRLAIFSGRTSADAFFAPGLLPPDDWIAFRFGGHIGSVGLPVGLMVRPLDWLAVAVESGYRHEFAHVFSFPLAPTFVPLAIEVAARSPRIGWLPGLEIGVRLDMPGQLSDPSCRPACPSRGWSTERAVSVWLRLPLGGDR